jgi:signal transduction histidine kinase/ligand-binding sensor domain-containing protein
MWTAPLTALLIAGQFTFRRIGTEQGLSQCTVVAMLQDRYGFMWFASQDGLNRYDGYTFTVYKHHPTDSSSLSSSMILSLYEDRTGTLWIGTYNGLNRFDRTRGTFARYYPDSIRTPQKCGIWNMTELPDGRLAITTSSGLYQFDTASKCLAPFATQDGSGTLFFRGKFCQRVPTHDGRFLVRVERRLYEYQPKTNRFVHCPYTPSWIDPYRAMLLPVYVDKAGTYWSSTEAYASSDVRGIYRFTPSTSKQPERWVRCNPIPQGTTKVSTVLGQPFQDRNGRIWIQAKTGLHLYDTLHNAFLRLSHVPSNPQSLGADHILCMYEDRSGLLWVSSNGSGLNIMLPQKFELHLLSGSNRQHIQERFHFVKGIAEDKYGRLWIAEYDHSLRTFDYRTSTYAEHPDTYSPADAKINSIVCLHPDSDGIIWFGGSFNRLGRYDPTRKTFRYFSRNEPTSPTEDLLLNRYLRAIAEDEQGLLWLATDRHGLQVFNKHTERFVGHFLGNLDVSCVFVSRTGVVYAGTDGAGIFAFISDTTSTGGSAGASTRKHKHTYTIRHYAPHANKPNSLSPYNTVKCFYEDTEGTIWIGLDGGGLHCFHPHTETFTRFTEQDGLPNNVVYGILPDDHGSLWLSTNKGLSKFHPATRTFRNYDVSDGLQANEFNTNAYCKLRSGKMVFGGIGGINMFHPDSVHDNTHIPPVILTNVLINDKPALLDCAVEDLRSLQLSYNDNTLSLAFAALDFANSSKNRYLYKMEGIDRDWVQSGSERTVRYAALPPGRYIFRVRACNNDGIWNEEGIALTIELIPPFWRTAWFYLLCVVVSVGIVAGTARFIARRRLLQRIERLEHERALERERLEKALAIERERGRISQDIHDEVGPGMTKILLLAGFAEMPVAPHKELPVPPSSDASSSSTNIHHQWLENAPQVQRLTPTQQLQQAVQDVIDSMNSIIWMTNPKNDTLDNLVAYLREYTAEYLRHTSIELSFRAPETIPPLHLYGTLRRNIFLTVKEALNNIVKHSHATSVQITLTMNPQHDCLLSITDNGKGFTTADVSRFGNGLENMKKRMDECQCGFSIRSAEHNGTTIILYIPEAAYRNMIPDSTSDLKSHDNHPEDTSFLSKHSHHAPY